MGLFTRRSVYDRTRILEEASRARAKGRYRKAIALYRRVLTVERENPELHWRIAPLLAVSGQEFDAWRSFRLAARDLIRHKRVEQALATYREACRLLPQQIDAWQAVARIERRLNRRADAKETLLEGRRAFRGALYRPQAIALLRQVQALQPWDPETVVDLAGLLAKSEQETEALWLLERLAPRVEGRELRMVRGAQSRITRSPAHLWLWLRASIDALRDGDRDEESEIPFEDFVPDDSLEADLEPLARDNVLPLSRSLLK